MTRRRQRECPDEVVWAASKEVALAVADTSTADELGQSVMDALQRMVGCDMGSIINVRPGQKWSTVGEFGGATDNRILEENYWRYSSEMAIPELSRMAGRFVSAVDVFEPKRREKLTIYREFLRPRRLRHTIVGNWVADGRVWTIGLGRTGSGFPGRAVARLNSILPHLRAALRSRAWRSGGEGVPGPDGGSPFARGARQAWGLTLVQERTTELVIRGLTNNEIGGVLGTSANTVRNTLSEVFKRVGASCRTELAFLVTSGAFDGAPRSGRGEIEKHRAFVATLARENVRDRRADEPGR
jgi:DNA-binding CsgD family transcriptional regulator